MQHARAPRTVRPHTARRWSRLERALDAVPDFAGVLSPLTAGAVRGALLAALAAFVLNCGVNTLLLSAPPVTGDAVDYLREARLMFASGIPVRPYYWPPGSQVLLLPGLWLLGAASDAAVHVYVAAISALTTGLLFLLAFTVSNRRGLAAGASALYALTPTTIYLSWQPESHVFSALSLVLFALCALVYLRTGRMASLAGAALAFGYCVLVRPGSSAMVPLCLVLPLVRATQGHDDTRHPRERLAPAAAGAVLAALLIGVVIGPAVAHNVAAGGGVNVSTNNERNFFLGNNRYTPMFKTGHLGWRGLESLPPETAEYLRAFYDNPDGRRLMLAEGWRFIRERPVAFVVRSAGRFFDYWTFDYEEGRKLQEHLQGHGAWSWLPMLVQAGLSVVFIWTVVVASLALWRTPHAWLVTGIWLAALLYALPHVLAFSSPVYRSGLHPLLALVAAVGVDHAARLQGLTARQASLAGAAWLAMSVRSHRVLAAGYVAINVGAAYVLVTLA